MQNVNKREGKQRANFSFKEKTEQKEKAKAHHAKFRKRETTEERAERLEKKRSDSLQKYDSMSNVEWNNMLDKKVLGRAKSCQIETDEEWNARRNNNSLNYRSLAKLTPEELKKKQDKDR